MLYFDNAATGGRKPDVVKNALLSAAQVCANPGRSGHSLSLACAKLVHDCRKALAELFHSDSYERVIFTKNCTEALNIALFGTLKEGDHAVATCMEHNSVLRPLEHLRGLGKITYDICPLEEDGSISPKRLAGYVRENTRLVAVTTASNVTGEIPTLAEIRRLLPKEILLLCDGAQGAGHFPIDMQALGIDLFTIAGHKGMQGIQGSGALLFSSRVEPTPLLYGGTGSLSISLDMPDFYPDALEAGTIAFPAVLSLLEGARFIKLRQKQISARLEALTVYFLNGLSKLTEYKIYSKPNPCGIVAFAHTRIQSEMLSADLSARFSIAVRGGLHCAPLIHQALGTQENGLVRASFSHFTSEREIDSLLAALTTLAKEA